MKTHRMLAANAFYCSSLLFKDEHYTPPHLCTADGVLESAQKTQREKRARIPAAAAEERIRDSGNIHCVYPARTLHVLKSYAPRK